MKIAKQGLFLISYIILLQTGCKQHKERKETEENPWSIAMANSEIERNPSAWMIDFQKKPKWSYVNGLVTLAMLKVWEQTNENKYFKYAQGYADTLITKGGEIIGYNKQDYKLDAINSGKPLFILYQKTGDERYRIAIETLYNQIKDQPRTPGGGFWHKKVYPNQMWLDGVYMGAPFYAQYAATFGDSSMFDDISLQFELIKTHAKDSATGWYYHGWDASKSVYWADRKTGLSQNFWGRGIGWYYMALIDVLDYFPKDHPKYQMLVNQFIDLSNTIVKNQDSVGLWYQVPNYPGREGNYHEATCSSMFTYGLMKGVDRGILDRSFIEPAMKGFNGMIDELIVTHPDGELELTQCCAGAGLGPADNPVRDGSYEYYINEKIRSNDGKGTGPFIMAALILENSKAFKEQRNNYD